MVWGGGDLRGEFIVVEASAGGGNGVERLLELGGSVLR